MPTLNLLNENLTFWSGIRISGGKIKSEEVNIWSAREHLASDWKPISGMFNKKGDEIDVVFHTPTNARHIKIDLACRLQSEVKFYPINYRDKSYEETKNLLRQKKIIFVGCARDCENGLQSSINNIKKIGLLFEDFQISIFENDSKDKTQEILESIHKQLNLKLFNEKDLDTVKPLRTTRLAYARNKLMDWALQQNSDYVAVVDMDTVLTQEFDISGFIDNFSKEGVWDAVFPVNNDFYYDLWALRKKGYVENDYIAGMNSLDASFGPKICRWLGASSKQIDLRDAPGWIEVSSAFGGMGLYKSEMLKRIRARYQGQAANGAEMCEHVPFNERLKECGANLYINPKFVVGTTEMHPVTGYTPSGIWNLFSS